MAKILIVDDHENNREFLRLLLTSMGHAVIEAVDGADGFAQIQSAPPDLIITDVSMPIMNGFQLVAAIRLAPELAALRVVFSTAMYPFDKIRELASTYGVEHILHLPTEPRDVIDVVSAALLDQPKIITPSVESIIHRLQDVITDLRQVLPEEK